MSIEHIAISYAGDTIVSVPADTVWVGNWPNAVTQPDPGVWVTSILPVLLSGALGFLAAHLIYEKQKRDASRSQIAVAYNLFYTICDEMRRSRDRVWNIIQHSKNRKHLKGPFILDARASVLNRLTEMMPPEWDPSVVYRFYELLALVAHHHNRATQIPFVSPGEAVFKDMTARRRGLPGDSLLNNDMRAGEDARHYARGFALYYYDRDDGDSLTSLYIEALGQLGTLSAKSHCKSYPELVAPTDEERVAQRETISTMMAAPDAPEMPYGELSKE